ncbi:MAG: FAD-dependent oxidoreductase [Chloroflexi bacterium]|nr:FAD-dependent oxidoreductase [Chloroflexota bacterium]MBI5704929.1 FAD-dependent oxidoreductase [Chloroflexota bacterium]
MTKQYFVAVVGAGPAGLFGARELANQGVRVVVFNRDIKPGGLAEYGIYPSKHTMKSGLRKQFRQALDLPNVEYFGNVIIGEQGDLTLNDLRGLGFQAILVTAGAQGTKWLGLPGENLTGVYHAKDVVYYYNQLPPYSQKPFRFGKRCAVIGAGNVMVDIAHYLIREQKVEEVIAIVRRGPAEVKFDKKEMEYVIANLDVAALDAEIQRVTPIMQAVGQDPAAARAAILEALPKALPKVSDTRFRFEFLASPVQMFGDAEGNLTAVEVEDNILVEKDGEMKAKGTGNKRRIDVETVIFAIGDKVDDTFGLPVEWNEFVKRENPRFPIEGNSFETPFDDVFVGGWSRKASSGLVGYARKDGTNAAKAVWQYLQTKQPIEVNMDALFERMRGLGKPVVMKDDIRKLEAAEAAEAQKRGLEAFKFDTNEEMLQAMGFMETA